MRTTMPCLALMLLSVVVASAGEVPFGHADWRPSPTDPVGFAGRGTSLYPGATPPLTFGEGRVTLAKVPVEVSYGNNHLTLSGPYTTMRELPVYADRIPKNILWKAATPGWSTSLPVAVGNRVITTHSPHYVVCWDAATGQVLWRDELKPLLLPTLTADRRSSAPISASATEMQYLHELGLAVYRLGVACSWAGRLPDPARRQPLLPLFDAVLTGLDGLRAQVPAAALPAFDEGVEQFRAGRKASETNTAGAFRLPLDAFPTWVAKTTGIPLGNCWPGWQISDAYATPVSDGNLVAVQFGHGQLAVYELADGNRLWALRDPSVQATSVSHGPSPLIWKNVLIANAGGGAKRCPTLIAFDTKTGAVLWESAGGLGGCPMGASHGDHMPHHLLRIGGRGLIVSNKGAVLDALNGKTLIESLPTPEGIKFGGLWGSGFVGSTGDLVLKTWGGDCSPPPCESWTLAPTGDTVVATARPAFAFPMSHGPWALSDRVMAGRGRMVDPQSGQPLATIPNGVPSVVGNHLVIAEDLGDANGRHRQDRLCLAKFSTVDITDPARPALVAQSNYLGTEAMPVDISDTLFPAVAQNPDLKALTLGGYHGVASVFGVMTSGVTARGNRLFILSQSHLYGIGPAVLGAPGDQPAVVAAIRAAKSVTEIVKYMESESAQYRFEAVRRLSVISEQLSVKTDHRSLITLLQRLALDDLYEEIRAQAVLALNASDPAGRAGWDRLMADYAVNFWSDPPPKEGRAYYQNHDRSERRQWVNLTLRTLGEQGRTMLQQHAQEMLAQALPLKMALDLATWQRWRIEPLVKTGLDVAQGGPLAKTDPWRSQVPVNTENTKVLPGYFAACDAASDPAAAEILLKVYPRNWALYPTFARHLKSEALLAWIEGCLLGEGVRLPEAIAAWKAIGPAAKPSMQKILATWDEQLKKLEAEGKKNDGLKSNRDTIAKALEESITGIKEK